MIRARICRPRQISVLCFSILVLASPLAAQTTIFGDDFESGTMCLWSSSTQQTGDTIYEIQKGLVPADTAVEVACGWVTGITTYGFFYQHPAGGQYSGIYVYAGADFQTIHGAIEVGDIVQVSGTYNEYYDFSEINCDTTGGYVVQGMGQPLAPSVVSTVDLQPAVAEPWESVLISVPDVVVTNPDIGYGEWTVSNSGYEVIIDDLMHEYSGHASGTLAIGDPFSSITGPLYHSFGAFKIVPRGEADFVPGP